MLVGAIACMLPNAKLVYVRRTPGDNALSLFEQSFLRGLNYSYDLGQIGAVYRQHLQLMHHWIETCGLPIHTVDYDLLVQDPETHIRRLLDFLGLDFRPECLAPHRVERVVRTSSVWQVRQPISANRSAAGVAMNSSWSPSFGALEGAMKRLLSIASAALLAGCMSMGPGPGDPRIINVEASAAPAGTMLTQSMSRLVQQTGPSYVTLIVHESQRQGAAASDMLPNAVTSGSGFVIDDRGMW
jgi:hypothetical protein